ncbi:MAG: PQQ-binding-like beta-propeller repeat protein [Phycisphaerae bacterium]|nr:PQQ-binding-like beta-propeller repeat protein [Phycisphaerae bacterium]
MTKPMLSSFVMTALRGAVVLVWPIIVETQAVRAETASEILEATGVKGGLVVHVGCGDGGVTAGLRAGDGYLVHGLEADAGKVAAARARIESLGLYGAVSVERWAGTSLPYADNLVNLLVAEDLGGVGMGEVLRVLAPEGVAYVKVGGKWTKTVKPRPTEIDEWTHYFHGADGNPVAEDTVVGPPRRIQWVGSPRWARHHDLMASMSALVSTGGRVFYIIDEGPTSSIQLPPKWSLIARDAFNGTILWRRAIAEWHTHLWALKSGPAHLPRRLVAIGDRVYVTLGLFAPVSALDAATGETVRTYEGTENAEELICSDGVLLVVVNESPRPWKEYRLKDTFVWDNTKRANNQWAWKRAESERQSIVALDAAGGKTLWRHAGAVAPLTLACDGGSVVFYDGERVVCLDRKDGSERWRSEVMKCRRPILTGFAPRLLIHGDVVVFSGGKQQMAGLSLADGKTLWAGWHAASGHNSPHDLYVTGGMVWAGATANGNDSGVFTGRDPVTGEVKQQFRPDVETYWFHHRCHAGKATSRYILPSRTGIEFVDFRNEHWEAHHWVRGGCVYGIMPCNGLVYAPPHSCACYLESKLSGFCALAPAAEGLGEKAGGSGERLERGLAYGQAIPGGDGKVDPSDWPTYRHDAARSGRTKGSVGVKLAPAWQIDLGGRLSSVVVADGKLYVARVDAHTVHALEAESGKRVWQFTAGGRIDSPPTIWRGRAVFGSADGWVYCLRASDGAMIWRFRAGPADRRIVAFEQLESAWPVHGSVLVQGGVVYCVAGRSMFLDGGLRLLKLDVESGRLISEVVLDDRDPESGKNLQVHVKNLTMPVALPDVLSSDGKHLYMRSQRFDLEGRRQEVAPGDVADQTGEGIHLFSAAGFVDDTWFHRSYWQYGRKVASGWGGWYRAGRFVPSGRILVMDDATVYGYGRQPEHLCQSPVLEYDLYAADRALEDEPIKRVKATERRINKQSKKRNADAADWGIRKEFSREELSAQRIKWLASKPGLLVRAMALAGKTLFVAGPPDVVDEERAFYRPDDEGVRKALAEQSEAMAGKKGGLLWAVSAGDGKRQGDVALDAPPVFDGMAAAGGRLFVALQNGRVVCLGDGSVARAER